MKPQDFLVGLRDFFGVVVPGATFLLCLPPGLLGTVAPRDATLAIFGAAIAAYLAGSVASAIGSFLDFPADRFLRSYFMKHRWKRLDERAALAEALRGAILKDALNPLQQAEYKETLKSFWWDHLRLRCPAAIAELDRIEAAQKLFRSLVPVFTFLAVWSLAEPWTDWAKLGAHPAAFAAAALAALALYVAGRVGFPVILYRYAASHSIAANEERRERDRSPAASTVEPGSSAKPRESVGK